MKAVKMYASQADAVLAAVDRDGVAFSKEAYVRKKYGESAWIFLEAYRFFVREAERYVKKPAGAEFPYWAYGDLLDFDHSGNGNVQELLLPAGEAVFFRVSDWNKILCMKYIGEDEAEEARFQEELKSCGLREDQVMRSSFYPEWKNRILGSWQRLFRFHEEILQGIRSGSLQDLSGIQAGLWQIRREWIVKRY